MYLEYTRDECKARTSKEELKEKDKINESQLNLLRKAAECHR